jgi:hypothetical protein
MRKMTITMYALAFMAVLGGKASAFKYSTAGVTAYSPCNVGPDLPYSVGMANSVEGWFNLAGFTPVSNWRNGDVWGSDFRDGSDLAADGGTDATNIYFYNGHGICEVPPGNATDTDHIFVCGNFGKPDDTVIGTSTRWGNGTGQLNFALIDGSCPMDLASLGGQWFPVLQGIHIATGHSGTTTADAYNSTHRGSDFVSRIVSLNIPLWWWAPSESIGDAWMETGTEDVQPGCCAVVIAGGTNQADAINRRDNEHTTDGMSNPTPTTWAAWRWVCA